MKQAQYTKLAIVRSDFQKEISDNLEKHCLKTLGEQGIAKEQVDIIHVPGSFEIPLAAKKLAKKKIYDAIIVFGTIRKGKTYHFELISRECARACINISLQFEIPIIFEVLTVYNLQDAIDRSNGKVVNRGREAALAALMMIEVLKTI